MHLFFKFPVCTHGPSAPHQELGRGSSKNWALGRVLITEHRTHVRSRLPIHPTPLARSLAPERSPPTAAPSAPATAPRGPMADPYRAYGSSSHDRGTSRSHPLPSDPGNRVSWSARSILAASLVGLTNL
jgi:hypothetical protein